MDSQQQFCLKWNSFGNNLVNTFDNLFKSASLTDVTLFCEGVRFQAHKLILAACSKHFQDIFEALPPCPTVVVVLDGTSSNDMSALLEFMYKGEVHVGQENLSSFLKAAEYLQVKGLSVEQERLVTQQHAPPSDSRVDSPSSSRNAKQNKINSQNMTNKMEEGRSGYGAESTESMLPPSSPVSNPYSSPYHMSYKPPHYEQRGSGSMSHTLPSGYDLLQRKRHQRSPNDTVSQRDSHVPRASVLRDGTKAERESPLSVGYTPPPSTLSHHYDPPLPPSIPPPIIPVDGSAVAGSYERNASNVANADKSPSSPHSWHSPSNCAEDLRVKNDLESGGSSIDDGEVKKYYSSGGIEVNAREREVNDRIPPPPPLEIVPSSPSGSGSVPTWNKMDQPHKGVTTTTTPDGKKLQCPFCERLYGYETNLRAHIRQRHQGIRVPCPYCSRTFTRNNTVRRHVAREHKAELSLNALQQGQVQNHNQ